MNESDDRKLQFEEYKLFRETVIHFDKVLLTIRTSTITLAFIIFGLAVETFRITNIPFGLTAIDLALILVLIELLMVMFFFHLEFHYRFYLTKIANIASEYEEKLKLGIELKNCHLTCDDKRASISKCLACIQRGMAFFTRVAHFNIYTSLLSLGLVAFTALMGIKINLSLQEISIYTIIMGLIAFGSFIVYGKRNISKQKGESRLDDNFNAYLLFIISFVILAYILYYKEFIEFSLQNMKFAWAFFEALAISIIIFCVYGLRKKIKELFEVLWDLV